MACYMRILHAGGLLRCIAAPRLGGWLALIVPPIPPLVEPVALALYLVKGVAYD